MINKEQVANELRQEAKRLVDAANILHPVMAAPMAVPTVSTTKNRIGHRRMSKAARAKISAAQKARWAKKNPDNQEAQAA